MPESTPSHTSRTAALVIAAAGALALGVFVAAQLKAPQVVRVQSGTLLTQPRPIAPFTLTDQDGAPFGVARLQGRWTLLFAGFTHCPDVCPTTLAVMKQLESRLPEPVGMVFLSVDPQRDAPAALRDYVRHFSPTIAGVTGARDQVDALCASLGLAYVKVPGASDADYTVDHSAALVLIDPQARVAGYFQPPHKADTLAADLSTILGSRT